MGRQIIPDPARRTAGQLRISVSWPDNAAHFAASWPQLDDVSRGVILGPADEPDAWYAPDNAQDDAGEPAGTPDDPDTTP